MRLDSQNRRRTPPAALSHAAPCDAALADAALRLAVEILATQADFLANEMEAGRLAEHDGPDALRLFATIARRGGDRVAGPAGHA